MSTDLTTKLAEALRQAIRQGEHDMLPTGEELREWNKALCQYAADQMRDYARAALAATPAAPKAEAYTSEKHFALREGHCIGASDAYFKAWPTHDNDAGRMLFDRGYARGFDKGTELSEARAALAATPAAPQWQPIETAPKKGPDVLLFGSLRGRVLIGKWGDYCGFNQPRITHWMPLPAAPGQGKESSNG